MKISAMENGPLLIESADMNITKQGETEKIDGKMIALCRCGHSNSKPFCDGAHKQAGFQAEPLDLNIN